MAGTSDGGKTAAEKNKQNYGPDFYKRIGAKGGKVKGIKKGFGLNPALASKAGKKGGAISRMPPRTHCAHGHELTPENRYPHNNSYICRICKSAYERRRWAQKKETQA